MLTGIISGTTRRSGRVKRFRRSSLRETLKDLSVHAGVAELADARDLKSRVPKGACGFDPRPRHSPRSRSLRAGGRCSGAPPRRSATRRAGTIPAPGNQSSHKSQVTSHKSQGATHKAQSSSSNPACTFVNLCLLTCAFTRGPGNRDHIGAIARVCASRLTENTSCSTARARTQISS